MHKGLCKGVILFLLLSIISCQFEPGDVIGHDTARSTIATGGGEYSFTFVNNSTYLILVVPNIGILSQFHVQAGSSVETNGDPTWGFDYNHADKVTCEVSDGMVVFSNN